jgi:simple sugar transport system ATP-binding protein
VEDVSMHFAPGEIVALVGENGAGKSTLMNVLSGLYQPSSGEILFDDQKVRFRNPGDAIARGIGMVHQHFMLVPTLTIAENVVLGREPRRRGLLDVRAAREGVVATARRFGFALNPEARIEDLTVGSQQKVEIVKVLYRGAQVLILDEPTAVLTPQESADLFAVMRQLAAAGQTVILISHKLREVLSTAGRIYVMRRGKLVAEVRPQDTSAEKLAALMVGQSPSAGASSALRGSPGAVVLEAEGLEAFGSSGLPALRGFSLRVRAGEIVGLAGVDGNGQRELAEVITGLRPLRAGSMRLMGTAVRAASAGAIRRLGVAHVPEDRMERALIPSMKVEENIALGRQREAPFARGPWIDFRGRHARAASLLENFDVRPRDPDVPIGDLSGGNQQKVVLARELDLAPRLLVVVQPTRGLDISAVNAVHERLRQERDRGAGVFLISLDLEEVLALSDRLYAIYEGRITGELMREEFDENRVGQMMMGTRQSSRAHQGALDA